MSTAVSSNSSSSNSSKLTATPPSPSSMDTNGNQTLITPSTSTPTIISSSNAATNGKNANDQRQSLLSILDHLKSIEKINEKRRNFLSDTVTITTTAEINQKTSEKQLLLEHCTGAQHATPTSMSSNGNGMHVISEEVESNGADVVDAAMPKSNARPLSIKYATLPMPTTPTAAPLRSPLTPPPKPPMLSRIRSTGPSDTSTLSPSTPSPTPSAMPMPIVTTSVPIVPSLLKANPPLTVTLLSPSTSTETNATTGDDDDVALRKQQQEATATTNVRPMSTHSDLQLISAKHYERLVEELRCPGCAAAMKAPILLCKSGHSICEQCTRILKICPLCKETFTTQRSRTVEALCAKAHFRCNHANGGCPVRMPIALLDWHERQCIYKPMKCFMGRVWGDCQWLGREVQWKEHLEAEHGNKVFSVQSVDLIWNMGVKQKPLMGYYVFQVYDEMFNFYEIYDKERVLFTMTCTSPNLDKKYNFAYEVTMIHPYNEALAISHKFPVHSEYDSDILQEGTCVSIAMNDLAKFIDDDKLLHYRVQVLQVKSPRAKPLSLSATRITSQSPKPIDFQLTQIEGGNVKGVPSELIITRQLPSDGGSVNNENAEIENNENTTNIAAMSDAEFEAYVARKWGTPQLNFNRKYLKSSECTSDGESSIDRLGPLRAARQELLDDKVSLCSTNTSYTKKVSNTLRKSFRAMKTDLIEMKPFSRKSNSNSPEKTNGKLAKSN